MSAPQATPATPETPEPRRFTWLASLVKALVGLVLVAAVSAGAAYGVFQWLIEGERAESAAFQQELQTEQERLVAQMEQVQQAAEEARLLMTQNGTTTTLDQRLQQMDHLATELQKTRTEFDQKLQAVQQQVVDQVAQQGKETAQALSLELQWKSLVTKAQGEVLLAQVHWAEGNRGLAKDELGIAIKSLQDAAAAAPDPSKAAINEVVTLAEEARGALILEQSSSRDSLNLLWHRVSDLLAPAPQAETKL